MKRLIGALLLTLGLAALPMGGAGAAPDDSVKGPACGDITVDAAYTAASGEATVYAYVDTTKPSCDRATYTLSVYATGLPPQLLGSDSANGDGTTSHFELFATPQAPTEVVCVQVTSSISGRTVDEAPNGPDGLCSIGTEMQVGPTGASGMR